jgi:hypothetical protein
MIQLNPSRTPSMIAAALDYAQLQTGMPTRACQTWGPAKRVQYDSTGQPIQQYLTLLIRITGGRYLLVRQVVDLDRVSRRQPMITEVSESAAQVLVNELELAAMEQDT